MNILLIKYNRIVFFIFFVIFSLVLFLPSSYAFIKAIFFGFLVLCIIFESSVIREKYRVSVFLVHFFLASLGLFITLSGIVFGYSSSPISGFRLLFLSIVFYLFFALFLSSRNGERFLWLVPVFYFSSFLIAINICLYILSKLAGYQYPLVFLDLDYRFGSSESGLFAYSTNNLPVLMFLIPFMIAHSAFSIKIYFLQKVIILFSVIVAFLSLRNAMILVVVASILLLLIMKRRWLLLLVFLMISLLFIVSLNVFYPEVWKTYIALKLDNFISGDDPRYNQISFWIDLISESPVFGVGLGSFENSGGALLSPYGYELTYLFFSASVGLIFSSIYYAIFFYVLVSLISIFKGRSASKNVSVLSISLFFGMIMFLVASFTNGYLMTTGYLWVVFLPLSFVLFMQNNFFKKGRVSAGKEIRICSHD